MVNTQKMAELIAEKASLTAGDVHNVIRNLMSVMREQLLNSRTVRLEGLGTFTMIAKAGGKGVELESKVSSSQITSLRCQFTPEYTRAANGSATRALTTGVEFVHIKDVAGSFVADEDVYKRQQVTVSDGNSEQKIVVTQEGNIFAPDSDQQVIRLGNAPSQTIVRVNSSFDFKVSVQRGIDWVEVPACLLYTSGKFR